MAGVPRLAAPLLIVSWTRPRYEVRHVIAAVCIVVLGACGSSGGDTSSSLREVAEPPAVTISMTEYRFAPARVALPAKTEVAIELRNDGGLEHDWALLSTPIEDEAVLGTAVVLARAQVNPGGTRRLTFTVPDAGVYQVVCTIPGHLSQGMTGTLEAQP